MGENKSEASEKIDVKAYTEAPDFSDTLKECYWKPGNGFMPPEPSDSACLPMVKVDGHFVPGDSPKAFQQQMLDRGLEFDISDSPGQKVLKSVMEDINEHDDNHDSSARENLASYRQKYGPDAFARLVDHLKSTASDDYNIFNNVSVEKDSKGHVTEIKVNHLDNNHDRVILFKSE